ncbi:MAG: PAS domain S-box protein [Pedobacter sp.]|nr:PAS domain S-box protein [Chitinophagaceae bacterium]
MNETAKMQVLKVILLSLIAVILILLIIFQKVRVDFLARRKATNELLIERRYQTLAEISPVGIFHTDATGFTTYVNPRWCGISGLTSEEALGNGWLNAVHEDDKKILAAGWEAATKMHEISFSEYRFIRPDGTIAWVIGQATPERNFKNEIIGYVGTTTDITERKKNEEAIKVANERFELIARATNDAVFELDLVTQKSWHNRAFLQLFDNDFNTENSELSIPRWKSKLHPDDSEGVITKLEKALAGTSSTWADEFRFKKANGNYGYFYYRAFISRDDACKAIQMIGSMIDITELNEAKNNIIKEKNLSDSIINSLPGVFYLITKNRQFLRWNKNLETVTKYTADEIITLDALTLFDVDEKELLYKKITDTFVYGEESVQANYYIKTKEKIPYFFTGKAIDYQGQMCLVGVGFDVSETVAAQEKIKQTTGQLRQLTAHLQTIREEERKRIGREIHDELGQQLTAIKMDIAWVDKKIPHDNIPLKNKLKNIIELLDGSNQSIRRILSELRPSILDDYGLLEAIDWLGRQFTSTTGIPVKFTTTETNLKTPEAIATCIFRVYQEAFTNITRHAKANTVVSSLTIINEFVTVIIMDDGQGFDMASQPNKQSFGILGMEERVLSLAGKFEFFSALGNGTKITISLPNNTI